MQVLTRPWGAMHIRVEGKGPALVIAGDADGASPPDLVRGTADLIADAAFHVIPGAGHLPPAETPAAWAALVAPFIQEHAR